VDNVTGEVSEGLDDGHRSSYTTGLWDGGEGSLTRCIKKRAASFQGLPLGHLEALQVVRYELNGYFNEHLDWFSHAENCTGNDCEPMGDRLSTFFVYLEADCTGGETSFPKLSLPEDMDQEWCEFVECGEGRTGVKWKPKAGNAIFWENLDKDGKGLTDMLHAGMPVTSGSKIGLNIWTRERDHNGWAPPKAEEKEEVEGSGEPQTTAFTNHHAEL
jgi:prolyl 4-hydroxylase